jgi:hypothetical protein
LKLGIFGSLDQLHLLIGERLVACVSLELHNVELSIECDYST